MDYFDHEKMDVYHRLDAHSTHPQSVNRVASGTGTGTGTKPETLWDGCEYEKKKGKI